MTIVIQYKKQVPSGRFSNILQVDIPANTYISLSANILEYNGTYKSPVQLELILEDGTKETLGIANDRVTKMQYTKAIKEIKIYQEGDMPVGTYAKFKNLQLEIGNEKSSYEPYGYNIPVRTSGKNLFDVDNFISTFNQFKPAGYETTKTEFDGYECIKVFGAMRSEAQNVQYLKDKFKSNTQYTFTMDIYDVSGETSTLKGISGKINYTDGTTDLFTLVAREFDVWQPISVVSKENKSIDYISFTYGTGAAYSYIKNWQIEEGTTATEYEPYNATTYNIYLKEPLRKVGSTADYIDCTTGEVVRYIRLKDTTGTKSIEESFEVLTTPTTEKVSVSDIDYTNKKYVSVYTTVTPSSIEARY